MAYRAYLSDLEREGRQTLGVLSLGMLAVSLVHPLFLLLTLPSTAYAWFVLYRRCRADFTLTFRKTELLKRALRFDDYDPDLAESIELGVHDGVLRLNHSQLESFWRSFESSCRQFGREALNGYSHLFWMILPLCALTLGLILFAPLRESWNWLPMIQRLGGEYWAGVLQVVAWLLGIAAATLGKYVIQVALVSAAWDAVVSLPPDALDGSSDASGPREAIITWKLPVDSGVIAKPNSSRS